MKPLKTTGNRLANIGIGLVLAAVPFHAFVTVWGSAVLGHYTLLRLWDDAVLAVVFGIAVWWLARDNALRDWFFESLLVRLIIAYAGLTLLLGAVSLAKGDVSLKALAYGVLINLRFWAWFLAVLLAAQRSRVLGLQWHKLVIAPAALVVAFAVLQYTVLPHNFLAHFGYNAASTIAPIETINHNSHYIRVQSTLRGANPLGAYLVVVLSCLGVLFIQNWRRRAVGVLGVLALFALYASGSRSAWLGVLVSASVAAWLLLPSKKGRAVFGAAALVVVIVAATLFMVLKNNTSLQNAVLHTQTNSAVKTSSNGAHASALKNGISDVAHQPLGDGPGTAGPASEYNTKAQVRIAEDYYVQIGQETGWLGLALFVTIVALVAAELYQRAGSSPLAFVLLISLVGLSFVSLLSHAWADDTLAFLWWGLAGIALGTAQTKPKKHEV